MNKIAWIGIILWGMFVTGCGYHAVGPASVDEYATVVQVKDVIFLLAGGLVTCLIGLVGLIGFMGSITGCTPWENHHVHNEHH